MAAKNLQLFLCGVAMPTASTRKEQRIINNRYDGILTVLISSTKNCEQ